MNYIGFNRKLDDYCLRQTAFTKKYLESIGWSDIWEIMQFYNTCISDSGPGLFTERPALRAYITFANSMRSDLFNLLMKKKEYEGNCIARVLNRYLVEESWKKQVTLKYLVALCVKRLGYDVSSQSEGPANLAFLIHSFYDSAMNIIKSKAGSVKVTL
jgi:hypothetical protein